MKIEGRLVFRVFLVLVLLFFAVKPYNYYCNDSGKCRPFYFSYLFSRSSGDAINLKFEATNYIENLDIDIAESELVTFTNVINELDFTITNNGRKTVEFVIDMTSTPQNFIDEVVKLQCPCSQKYRLRKGEEKKIRVIFKIRHGFYEKDMESKMYKIRFQTSKIKN